jgi:hypothetical protein
MTALWLIRLNIVMALVNVAIGWLVADMWCSHAIDVCAQRDWLLSRIEEED